MEGIAHTLTRMALFWASDMPETLIWSCLCLLGIMFLCFMNIYDVDKYEFLCEKQALLRFERNLFFVINYSKDKRTVAKKTLVLEMIGYSILAFFLVAFAVTLCLNLLLAVIVWSATMVIAFLFLWITGGMYQKARKMYRSRPIRYDDDD